MEYVIGIDIGTGSVKAVAVNLQGKSFEVSQQHYAYCVPKPGFHEQDPEEIWMAFKTSIKEVIAKIGVQPLAISLSSAMHSLIAVDQNGIPLAPMMTWADNRSSEIAKRLRATAAGLSIYKATGTPLHAMSPLCKLIWLLENDAKRFHQTHKFISIKEYIWYKLFKEFKIDHSIASCTGLFALDQLIWHEPALALAGISAELLSEPVPTHYRKSFPGHPELHFLEENIPFIIGASDGCLANLGSMANQPGVAVITIGTSGAIRMASSKPLPNDEAMTFSYILDQETFICGGPINNGGIALQWWLKNNTSQALTEKDYDLLFQQIKEVPVASNGLLFLPYLTGERAPIWDSESCGTFFGIKLQHTRAHFSRAVLEGICYALKSVMEAVQQNAEPITQINISGGFVKSEVWVQILADLTGKKLVIVQTEDASAVGAAFMALKSLGFMEAYPQAKLTDFKVIDPDPLNQAIYAKHFIIFKKLYSDLKETMHQLSEMNV